MNGGCGFIIIKPDAVEKNVVGKILNIFEENGFYIGWMKAMMLHSSQIHMLYKEHLGKDFMDRHEAFMMSGPVVAVKLWHRVHDDPTEMIAKLCGVTDPMAADPESIRGRFGSELPRNAVHFSDSMVVAAVEADFIFGKIG